MHQRDYWESLYREEYDSFIKYNLYGEDWFEQYTDGGRKIVNFIDILRIEYTGSQCSFLDLGCGNGQFLFLLDPTKFTKILGVDYSSSAIELAKEMGEKKNSPIDWLQADVFALPPRVSNDEWNIIHDKGTLDAIELQGTKLVRDYLQVVVDLLAPKDGKLSFYRNLTYPVFRFGGQEGTVLVTAAFVK
ncbi:Protein-lysine N-methyltransferase EFM4 [Galdieria sulphuraria]|nr:Protein-lysine N-methyltransferase EFM4 [Galdieria sulphuraria]